MQRIRTRSTQLGRPLHILLISPTFSHMGGADRDWVTLSNAMEPGQIRISWVGIKGCDYLRPYIDPNIVTRFVDAQFPSFTYLINENALRERSMSLWTKITVDHMLRMVRPVHRLYRALQDDPVDLIVSNTAGVTIGAIIAKLRHKPHVWCVKECLDPALPDCRRFARFISRMSSAVIVPSQAAARPFPSSVQILPDGNDVEAIRLGAQRASRTKVLRQIDLPPERPVVAQVGAIVWWKGQHVTVEALLRIAAREQHPSFSLVFLGEGSAAYRKQIDQALGSAPRHWRDAVRFVRFDPDDFSWLAASDVVVHPSVLPDPLPNAVREAMILGKAVIASRNGGIVDMIRDGETGVLCQPGNSDELAAAISRLVQSASERERLGEAARNFAGTHFDIDLRKQAFSALFRSLVPEQSV